MIYMITYIYIYVCIHKDAFPVSIYFKITSGLQFTLNLLNLWGNSFYLPSEAQKYKQRTIT